jgi:hypothetical protein
MMKTLIHSKELSITKIMVQVQEAGIKEELPLEIKIGQGTYKIKTPEDAAFFCLGILAYIDAREEQENWHSKTEKMEDLDDCTKG